MSIILSAIAAACFSAAADPYTAGDFFIDSELGHICALEPISAMEKKAIIASGFTPDSALTSPFSVVSMAEHGLRLRDVAIYLYPFHDGCHLVSVTSILGNHGQNQHTRFFEVDSIGVISAEYGSEGVGIHPVLRNEFLDQEDFFPDEENGPVPLYVMNGGGFEAEPWTWMAPEWIDRKIVRRIIFVWTGGDFTRVAVPL